MEDDEQKVSAYGLVMDEVIKELLEIGAFDCLRRTSDFYATRLEHNY
jgi:hypothetical protein|tara:strand:+ start:557 stop:697 length:141 start_codon:yes stop_codon:yes gene_type:complete